MTLEKLLKLSKTELETEYMFLLLKGKIPKRVKNFAQYEKYLQGRQNRKVALASRKAITTEFFSKLETIISAEYEVYAQKCAAANIPCHMSFASANYYLTKRK